jgi:hypothetical protein
MIHLKADPATCLTAGEKLTVVSTGLEVMEVDVQPLKESWVEVEQQV